MFACLITSGLFYWRVKHSILEEMGINHMFGVEEICLSQFDSPISDCMIKHDRNKLFMILSYTQKYDKHKDWSYLLDGNFLYDPTIRFGSKPFHFGQGDRIHWDYQEGVFIYYYPGEKRKHSCKYYLERKYAQELKVLFDKYSTSYRY